MGDRSIARSINSRSTINRLPLDLSINWKRLHGAKLDGAKHFQKNCQNVPGAAGAAVGAAAASATTGTVGASEAVAETAGAAAAAAEAAPAAASVVKPKTSQQTSLHF